MQRCTATTKTGKPCQAAASSGGLCFLHANPERAKQLGQLGGRANGKSSGVDFRLPEKPTATDLRDAMTKTINAVLSGELQDHKATTIANLIKTHGNISVAIDLESRITKLELDSVKNAMQQHNAMSGEGNGSGENGKEENCMAEIATASATEAQEKAADDPNPSGATDSTAMVATGNGGTRDMDVEQPQATTIRIR